MPHNRYRYSLRVHVHVASWLFHIHASWPSVVCVGYPGILGSAWVPRGSLRAVQGCLGTSSTRVPNYLSTSVPHNCQWTWTQGTPGPPDTLLLVVQYLIPSAPLVHWNVPWYPGCRLGPQGTPETLTMDSPGTTGTFARSPGDPRGHRFPSMR